jgi:hypothetical protein
LKANALSRQENTLKPRMFFKSFDALANQETKQAAT